MSPTALSTKKAGSTFLWVLAAFAIFPVLFFIFQSLFATQGAVDPLIPDRLANKEEITKAQNEALKKLGLNDKEKKAKIFDQAIAALKAKPEGPSAQVVPGSPTQLKQAAAPAPEAAAPAPAAPAPATPPPAN